MKKTILSIFAFSGLLASAQLTDLPLTASQDNIFTGQSVNITTSGSQIGTKYYLRNNTNNNIVYGPIQGTGSNLDLYTGALALDASYNVFASQDNMVPEMPGLF